MPTFKCSYLNSVKTEIEADSYESAAATYALKFPSDEDGIYISKGFWGNKFLINPGKDQFIKMRDEEKIRRQKAKQKAKEEALSSLIQKVTNGGAENLYYGEVNMVVENFFAHAESFGNEEADLRRELYALTLTNSTLQGLIQTTILSRLISDNSSKDTGTTAGGGNSMGKALVAASLLNNQQLRGMSEDVEDISEGFGFDGE